MDKKIALGLMPFWSPLALPLGISSLKGYLEKNGINVYTFDCNVIEEIWGFHDQYFTLLKKIIPVEKRSNFYMVGYDILNNHLVSFINKKDDALYHDFIKALFLKNMFVKINDDQLFLLNQAVDEFFKDFEPFIIQTINSVNPDYIGLSVYSTSLGPALFAFQTIKKNFPKVKTIMGGGVFADHLAIHSPNFLVFLNETKNYIDAIICGEGELLLLKYLTDQLDMTKRVYTLEDVVNENLDLNSLPTPDFNDFSVANYPQMSIYASRSCPFQCGFCSETVQWGKYRKKNSEKILGEIRDLKRRYGGILFMFGDSLLNPVIDSLSQSIKESDLGIYFDGYLRVDPAVSDPSRVKLWREAGFYRARLGIESGSMQVLSLMNKKITVSQIKSAIINLANHGIKTTTYWVIGYPGEREEDFLATLELINELKDYIYEADWHPFYFFPNGQVNSQDWVEKFGIEPLYSDEYRELFLFQTWALKTNPEKEEIYDRMVRFGKRCQELNIPNPYSMMEIYHADKRWKKLHPNAGPTLLELHNCKNTR